MVLDAGPMTGGVGGVRGRVIEAAGFQPVAAAFVLFTQNGGTDAEVSIGVEGQRWIPEPFLVPVPVDLHESYIDVSLSGREVTLQGLQGLLVGPVSLRSSTHIEGPGPRPCDTGREPRARLGGGQGVQNIRWDALGLRNTVVTLGHSRRRLGCKR